MNLQLLSLYVHDYMEIITWVKDNWQDIAFAVTSIVTGVSLIVKLTPTLNDDNVWLPIVKFLSKYIALNRTTDDDAVRKIQGD